MVNIHEAKTNFSKLLAKVENGDEIVIARAGTPIARLLPMPKRKSRKRSGYGKYKGQIWMSDDFDEPMPELETHRR